MAEGPLRASGSAGFTPLRLDAAEHRAHPRPIPPAVVWHPLIGESLATLPGGDQHLWGIPFHMVEADSAARWVWLGPDPSYLVLESHASWIVIAHFCGASRSARRGFDHAELPSGMVQDPGVRLADYVLEFEDGTEYRQAIRRRFEINDVFVIWGQLAFAARPHRRSGAVDWRGPHRPGQWGRNQMAAEMPVYEGDMEPWPHRRALGNYWLYALPNPRPADRLAGLRLEWCGVEQVAVAGVTMCHRAGHPLRYGRLQTLRVELPAPRLASDVQVEIDLGVVARQYSIPPFDANAWLGDEVPGWGAAPVSEPQPDSHLLLDVTASDAARLLVDGQPPRVDVVASERTWVHVTVLDASTGGPTPCRVHLRSPVTGYLPPYGHRREVNDGWFEDYGADLKLGDTPYAYVDGSFHIELPIGDVFVEVVKGFEYRPLRTRLTIQPGQSQLRLELRRELDWRRQGWATADTHVHFLSPDTAWLEAQAEGVNLVHLLAAQWGDLFTNVGDFSGALAGVSRDDTLVWVGAEHRQHLLGHISLLGTRGGLIVPLSASGPEESYLGDPTWVGLTDWADACRARDGVVVVPHFPNPLAESVADVILGKVDALELRDFHWGVDSEGVHAWYRFLNCGYRVAAVGGTDKMSAAMPLGGVRTYAQIGDRELTFDAWADAVRHGRTFSSSGPLLELSVEGRPPGAEIRFNKSGGNVEVEARAVCVHPMHRLEIVQDGRIVARAQAAAGARELRARARVSVTRGGWIATRCDGEHRLWHGWPVVLAAHSSPVYLTVEGKPAFSADDAAYMLALLDGATLWLDTLATPPNPDAARRLRSVFDRARSALFERQRSANL